MKNSSLMEKIGATLIVIGLVLLVIHFAWKNSPIPVDRDSAVFLNCVGLVVLVLGRRKREKAEKEINQKK